MRSRTGTAGRWARLRALTPCAVDFRFDDDPARLLTEADMRSIAQEVLAFASAEIRSTAP
jgi:hypothetical protein